MDLISREAAIKEANKIVIDGDSYDVVQVETLMGIPFVVLDAEIAAYFSGRNAGAH